MSIGSTVYAVLTLTFLLGLCSGEGYIPYLEALSSGSPIVATDNGCVKGTLLRMPNSDVSVFLGIPYAKPPVGSQRFKKPVPVRNWQGIYDATIKPPSCVQYSIKELPWIETDQMPSEDCLYLNIWVPNGFPAAHSSKLPVMVWIHGGAFVYGSSSLDVYDGSTLADNGNVVVVSLNYRLGVFGFLDAGIDDAPGNMGLLDQALALKWIKDNIENFGGHPDCITLFGQSAGAVSVGLHMVSPMSRHLFDKAIMQSGSPYHPILGLPPLLNRMKGSTFAAPFGCSNETLNLVTNPKRVVECLRKIDAGQLAHVEGTILDNAPFYFVPTFGNEFMPKPPIEYIEAGDVKEAKVLLGNVKDEGSFLINYVMPQIFDKHYVPPLTIAQAKMFISALFQNSTAPTPDVVADFYLRNVDPQDSQAVTKAIYDSFGDYIFSCPTHLFAKKAKNDVFFYEFTHKPTNSKWGDWMGTVHFDEVPFVFGEPIRNPLSYTAEEGRFSQNIIQKWANFAYYGSPALSKSTEYWPEFTAANPLYMELNPRSHKIRTGLKEEVCAFWYSYFVTSR